jgi:iron complex outermembrane receptor protein
MPTVSELYQGGFNSAGQIINNDPNLRPERSWTGEMSLEREVALSRWRLTAFAEDTKDGLYSQVNLATNASTVQNVDHIRTSGLEFAWTQKEFVAKTLELNTSVTYARSKIVANAGMPSSVGKYQPRVPKLRATAQLTYRPNEAWSVSYAARYSGKQFNQLDNSDVNGFVYQGTSEFFTTDLRVQYRADRHWTVSAGVDNLNGDQYWNFHNYPQRTFHGEVQYRF